MDNSNSTTRQPFDFATPGLTLEQEAFLLLPVEKKVDA